MYKHLAFQEVYVGRGVKLSDLFDMAGIKGSAQQIRFISRDGYYMTFTVKELLRDERYRFPNFKAVMTMPTGIFQVLAQVRHQSSP